MPNHGKTQEESFWHRVRKTDGCWLWTTYVNDDGYGRFPVRGTQRLTFAHRYSWELHFGSVPGGLFVLHNCDNPPCVRPDHLFLGTRADNNHDRHAKGRSGGAKGEHHGQAKLTNAAVREIRERYSRRTSAELARKFGINISYVPMVAKRRTWSHVA